MQDQAQESSQPGEDETEVVTRGGENDVGGVAFATLEPAAAEITFVLHVSDHRLDGGAPPELALNNAEHPALLAGDEEATRACGVVAAIVRVEIAALNGAAGELFCGLDDGAERVAVVRMACSTNCPPGARALVVTIEALTPNS